MARVFGQGTKVVIGGSRWLWFFGTRAVVPADLFWMLDVVDKESSIDRDNRRNFLSG